VINETKKSFVKNLTYGFSLARAAHYSVQAYAMSFVDLVATGKKRDLPKDYFTHMKEALPKIQALLKQDSDNIAAGLYPVDVLTPENPLKHTLRVPRLIEDAWSSIRRRQNKVTDAFDKESEEFLSDLPDYYKRNFHYQTGGYMSKASADLYEQQVEILFSGAADAMRRLILPHLKEKLKSEDGEGLHFLEIASGTGRLTKFMAMAFPKAQITCLDLSPYYLQRAKKNLSQFKRINFTAGNAEKMNFKDATFDAVFSCFLFHELPRKSRETVMKESLRVLKSGGAFGFVDSLQKNDDEDFNWALERFPIDFHEPFYKDYTLNPIEDLMHTLGIHEISRSIGFLSKTAVGLKPTKP
jgi:ubiquinone/menaquinone biosynthesis C-methylase UbiE